MKKTTYSKSSSPVSLIVTGCTHEYNEEHFLWQEAAFVVTQLRRDRQGGGHACARHTSELTNQCDICGNSATNLQFDQSYLKTWIMLQLWELCTLRLCVIQVFPGRTRVGIHFIWENVNLAGRSSSCAETRNHFLPHLPGGLFLPMHVWLWYNLRYFLYKPSRDSKIRLPQLNYENTVDEFLTRTSNVLP